MLCSHSRVASHAVKRLAMPPTRPPCTAVDLAQEPHPEFPLVPVAAIMDQHTLVPWTAPLSLTCPVGCRQAIVFSIDHNRLELSSHLSLLQRVVRTQRPCLPWHPAEARKAHHWTAKPDMSWAPQRKRRHLKQARLSVLLGPTRATSFMPRLFEMFPSAMVSCS